MKNPTQAIRQWERFKRNFPKASHGNEMLKLDFEFNLEDAFFKKDFRELLTALQESLVAIDRMDRELDWG